MSATPDRQKQTAQPQKKLTKESAQLIWDVSLLLNEFFSKAVSTSPDKRTTVVTAYAKKIVVSVAPGLIKTEKVEKV